MKLFSEYGENDWQILSKSNGWRLFRYGVRGWHFNEGGYLLTISRFKIAGLAPWRIYIGYGRFSHVFRW